MFRIIIALVWLALAFPCQAQMTTLGAGGTKAAVASYQGPGDINGAADAWYGTRGFSAAYAAPGTNPAVDLVDQAGANPITINILSNGKLDVATINTWVTAHSVTTIKISKLYDQSGNAHHISNATLANMPILNLSAVSSLPAVQFTGAMDLQTASAVNFAGPFSYSTVYDATVSGTIIYDDNNGNTLTANTSLHIFVLASSSGFNSNASASAFHAAQALSNGASSSTYIDGASTSGSVTTTFAFNGHLNLGAQTLAGGSGITGFICEVGLWPGDKSANNSSINSNQHAYWGF